MRYLKVGIPSRTTRIPKEWEGRGETIIRTIFQQHIGGVAEKRVNENGWVTADQSVTCRNSKHNLPVI